MTDRKAVLSVSGKGGTGKTIVGINIAQELAEQGKKVALIDGDIDSPNVGEMLQIKETVKITGEKRLTPLKVDGMQVFSFSLIAPDQPISMEGREYSEILRDVVEYADWDAEYFVVDMPAGSSDEFRKMVSIFDDAMVGSVVVTQPAHLLDAERVIKLHLNNEIPLIGLIENMSYFACANCEEKYEIFGPSGGVEIAKKYGLEFLGAIPLAAEIREAVANGKPRLEGAFADPIKKATSIIVEKQPQRPGFLRRVTDVVIEKTREALIDTLFTLFKFANEEINIRDLQEKHAFPGGRIIRLNLFDDAMEKIIVQADFRVENGKLLLVKQPRRIDTEIDLRYKALAWALLGSKNLSGGKQIPYSFQDAWFMGDAKVWGSGDTIRALYFILEDVWGEVATTNRHRIEPLLKALV